MKLTKTTIEKIYDEIDKILLLKMAPAAVKESARNIKKLLMSVDSDNRNNYHTILNSHYYSVYKQKDFKLIKNKYDSRCQVCNEALLAGSNTHPNYVLWKKGYGTICSKLCQKPTLIDMEDIDYANGIAGTLDVRLVDEEN